MGTHSLDFPAQALELFNGQLVSIFDCQNPVSRRISRSLKGFKMLRDLKKQILSFEISSLKE
jgi:hypothetical protein